MNNTPEWIKTLIDYAENNKNEQLQMFEIVPIEFLENNNQEEFTFTCKEI